MNVVLIERKQNLKWKLNILLLWNMERKCAFLITFIPLETEDYKITKKRTQRTLKTLDYNKTFRNVLKN